jgi:putative two-component system response regulator
MDEKLPGNDLKTAGWNPSILIVDDTPANLQLLSGMLKDRGYRARPVPSGILALQAASLDPPDLILLDISMPDMDGYEVCMRLKTDSKLKDIPVIFISALTETLDKLKAFSIGGVDYITKPFQFEEIHARINTHLSLRRLNIELEKHNHQLQELVLNQIRELYSSQMATIFALAKLAELRDDDTGRHLDRVQIFCKMLSVRLRGSPYNTRQIDTSFIDNIHHASPLHDIGKVSIPDSILLKQGRLTPEEFEIMKSHAATGAHALETVRAQYPRNDFLDMGILIARSHHEKWDGKGYPDGISGESIPLPARIMAIVDVYDALRSKRCYKDALNHEETCKIIYESSGTHFDPKVVAAFRDLNADFDRLKVKLA